MKREYSDEEVKEFVVEVEKQYEQILQNDLVRCFFRFRVRSYYNAYNKLLLFWLDAFDEAGMLSSEGLVGLSQAQDRSYLDDEFDTVYFMPVSLNRLVDGEEVIKRLLYFYTGKNKQERVSVLKELLADYRERFMKPHQLSHEQSPCRSSDAT